MTKDVEFEVEVHEPTTKVRAVTREERNELEAAQAEYNKKFQAMIQEPTDLNIELFNMANKKLWETKDAYRLGKRLLAERAARLIGAVRNFAGW